jgi:hypothetical protein
MKEVKILLVIAVLSVIQLIGCTGKETGIPDDFSFLINVRSTQGYTNHYHIEIDSLGKGSYILYDTEGSIEYKTDGMIVVPLFKTIERGKFDLTQQQLSSLLRVVEENSFFTLEEAYQMSLGHSFAFIAVTLDGQTHQVDNIGMEVPELRAIVSGVQGLLPARINIDYGEGFVP